MTHVYISDVVSRLPLQADGEQEVLVAGDPEKKSMKKVEEDGGITYHPNFIKHLVCITLYKNAAQSVVSKDERWEDRHLL